MANEFNPFKKINTVHDFNYFNKLSVAITDGYFPDSCQALIPFSTYAVSFQLESGGPLEYSFDGYNLHGDMTSGLSSESLLFENRVICKIWFRGTGVVRIEAWSIR